MQNIHVVDFKYSCYFAVSASSAKSLLLRLVTWIDISMHLFHVRTPVNSVNTTQFSLCTGKCQCLNLLKILFCFVAIVDDKSEEKHVILTCNQYEVFTWHSKVSLLELSAQSFSAIFIKTRDLSQRFFFFSVTNLSSCPTAAAHNCMPQCYSSS